MSEYGKPAEHYGHKEGSGEQGTDANPGDELQPGCYYQGHSNSDGYVFTFWKNGKKITKGFGGRNLKDAALQCYTESNE